MRMMKIAVLHGAKDLRLDDAPAPVAGESDVVIQVKFAGICGSDLGTYQSGWPTGEPVPLGHELSGIVAEAGNNVSDFEIGDRVILNPMFNWVGIGGPEGGFAERLLIRDIVSRPESLIRIPASVSFESGALVEPLAVSFHAINRADVQPGAKVALFGAGPIGLCLIIALRLKGIDDIIAFDLSAFRRERALALGARAALDPRERPPGDVLKEMHGTDLYAGFLPVAATDVYFEASGAPQVLPEIIDYARSNSDIVVVAIHKKPVSLNIEMMVAKEISLLTAVGYPTEMPDVVAMLDGVAPDLAPLISHRFAAEDFLQAFGTACNPESSAKVLIQYP